METGDISLPLHLTCLTFIFIENSGSRSGSVGGRCCPYSRTLWM